MQPRMNTNKREYAQSEDFVYAGARHGRHGKTTAPIQFFGEDALLRVHRLVPGDFLAGVGGHAAHHREQRAGGHALPVVDGFALPYCREEHVVLVLIHVVLLAFEGPRFFAGNSWQRTTADGAGALTTQNVVGVFVPAVVDLAASEECAEIIRVKVIHLEVIVDVAALGGNLAAADANAADGRLVLHRPGDLVGAVHGLLHHTVAAQPLEVVPVLDLPLDIAHAGGPFAGGRHRLHPTGVISRVVSDQIADGAGVDLIERRDHVVAIAPAEAGDQRKIFFFGELGGLEHVANAGRIHCD